MKVPVLKDGALTVWESMAILEYAAEVYPDAGLWPEHREQRATARAMSGEMHSGFAALRSACPMNMRRDAKPIAVTAAMSADIERIVSLWSECLDRSGGPFLFGDFTIADAMYAPVVSRFGSYGLTQDAVAGRYCATMKALPVWRDWETAARTEPWTITSEEI